MENNQGFPYKKEKQPRGLEGKGLEQAKLGMFTVSLSLKRVFSW
jgi:hypothetical protein